MFIDQGHPTQKILKLTKIPSSTWYKRRRPKTPLKPPPKRGRPRKLTRNSQGKTFTDLEVADLLKSFRKKKFLKKTGYRKLTHYLRRDHQLVINHKKVYRLYSWANLTLPKKKKSKRRGKKICENRKVTGPNQLWQFDVKYGYVDGENRFFFLMGFIDTFNREIMHYHVGLRCQAKDILFALKFALKKHNVKSEDLVIRSDNGTQMTSYMFKKEIEELGLEHEFTPPATPNLNAYIESFFSIVDRELFDGRTFDSFKEAYEEIVDFIDHYNNDRLHSSLKMMTPREFTEKYEEDRKRQSLAA